MIAIQRRGDPGTEQGHSELPAPATGGLEGRRKGKALLEGGVRADEEGRTAPKGREEDRHHRHGLQGLRGGHPQDVHQGRLHAICFIRDK